MKSCEMQNEGMHAARMQAGEISKDIERLERRVAELEEEKKRLEKDKGYVEKKLLDFQATNGILSEELNLLISQIASCVEIKPQCRESCPRPELCAKRILIVGGLTKMKQLYQNLVESSGGQFEYHDGYMHNGMRNLEDRVKRCDLVICPVNCNSHGACSKVKEICQKHRKPFKMLPSSSLSAISGALFEGRTGGNRVLERCENRATSRIKARDKGISLDHIADYYDMVTPAEKSKFRRKLAPKGRDIGRKR